MKPMPEISPFPLTAELFDAMFENEAFRARLKAHWEEVAAEKKVEDLQRVREAVRKDFPDLFDERVRRRG